MNQLVGLKPGSAFPPKLGPACNKNKVHHKFTVRTPFPFKSHIFLVEKNMDIYWHKHFVLSYLIVKCTHIKK